MSLLDTQIAFPHKKGSVWAALIDKAHRSSGQRYGSVRRQVDQDDLILFFERAVSDHPMPSLRMLIGLRQYPVSVYSLLIVTSFTLLVNITQSYLPY